MELAVLVIVVEEEEGERYVTDIGEHMGVDRCW